LFAVAMFETKSTTHTYCGYDVRSSFISKYLYEIKRSYDKIMNMLKAYFI